MWDVLKPTDLECARRELNERRAELLRRQASEMAALQADEADLEALDRLAAAFAGKFKKAAAPTPPSIPVSKKPDPAPIQHQPVTPRPQPRPEKRSLSGTNFEVFSRAVSKSGF
jgi:hypothetical protein